MDTSTLTRRDRRRLADLTLQDIANAVGVSESLIHRWERGTRSPSVKLAKKWEAALSKAERKSQSKTEAAS